MSRAPLSCIVSMVLLLSNAAVAMAENWPGWRGPTGQGHCAEKDLPLTWNAKSGANILWKALLHGGVKNHPEMNSPGWSCPIVWDDRVFITTAIWPVGLSHDERMKTIPAHHVLAYGAGDGTLRWDTLVPSGKCLVDNVYHGYAVSTPVTDGKLVYVAFGSGVVAALDFDGKIVWREELARRRDVYSGLCGSPTLYQDTLILAGIAETGLCALECTTGKVRWEQRSKENNLYATPALLPVAGQTHLIHVAGGVQGLDPASGALHWSCRVPTGLASPVFGAGLIYVDAGRGGSVGSAVKPGGTGDVSKTSVAWQTKVNAPAGSSGICVGDYLYRACSADVLRCWKMASGELVYEERLPRVSPSSSPIASTSPARARATSSRPARSSSCWPRTTSAKATTSRRPPSPLGASSSRGETISGASARDSVSLPAVGDGQQLAQGQFEARQKRSSIGFILVHDDLFGRLGRAAAHRERATEAIEDPVFADADVAVFLLLLDVIPLPVALRLGHPFGDDAGQISVRFRPSSQSGPDDAIRTPAVGASDHGLFRQCIVQRRALRMRVAIRQQSMTKLFIGATLSFVRRRSHDQPPIDELVAIISIRLLDGVELFGGQEDAGQLRSQDNSRWRNRTHDQLRAGLRSL
jgi:outer membrane protein assembly factor BamB